MFVSTTVAPALLALAARALALPSADRRATVPTSVWEAVDAAPPVWAKDDIDADADEVFELRIQLAQQNMAQFEQLALAVSRIPFPVRFMSKCPSEARASAYLLDSEEAVGGSVKY
jgi:hypothetical protein